MSAVIVGLLCSAVLSAGTGRTAMLPLVSFGSTDESREAVERVLDDELRRRLGTSLVAPDELPARGELADRVTACEGARDCLVEIGREQGWSDLITGNVAGLGDERVVHLTLTSVETGTIVRRATATLSGDRDQLVGAIREVAVRLVAPAEHVGRIEVRAEQSGLEIKVDGLSLGETPLASPTVSLPVGTHALEARGEGLVPLSKLLDIPFDQTVPVVIVLPESTVGLGGDVPFRYRWWTWTIAGVGVTALGVGVLFNVRQADSAQRVSDGLQTRTLTPDRADLYRDEQLNWDIALTSYIVGGALVALAGTLLGLDLIPAE